MMDVVIPCYNSARFLPAAIESIRAQTAPVGAVIVVDDGSSDDSVRVAQNAGCLVTSTKVNSGPSRARNIGVALASSEFVAFLDADDAWAPEHLSELQAAVCLSPGVNVVFSRSRRSDGVLNVSSSPSNERAVLDLSIDLLGENVVAQSGAAVRRRAFLEIGGYSEDMRYAEDYELWLRMSRVGTFGFSPAVTVNYRLHPAQASRNHARLIAGSWKARLRHFEWIRTERPSAESAAAARVIAAIYETDLGDAWYWKNREAFETLLATQIPVAACEQISKAWRRRASWLWWPSVTTRALASSFREPIRQLGRMVRSR